MLYFLKLFLILIDLTSLKFSIPRKLYVFYHCHGTESFSYDWQSKRWVICKKELEKDNTSGVHVTMVTRTNNLLNLIPHSFVFPKMKELY